MVLVILKNDKCKKMSEREFFASATSKRSVTGAQQKVIVQSILYRHLAGGVKNSIAARARWAMPVIKENDRPLRSKANLLAAVPVCRAATLWARAPRWAVEQHVEFWERGWTAREFPAPGVASWALAGVEGSYSRPPLCPLSAPQRQTTLPKHWAPRSPCWFSAL